jgi:hypothetical protein
VKYSEVANCGNTQNVGQLIMCHIDFANTGKLQHEIGKNTQTVFLWAQYFQVW